MYIDQEPKYIVLYATSDCNHQCSHCFLEHNLTWNADELDRITHILSKRCLVHINGAEPLLHPELLRAYKAANQRFVFTNGLVFLGKDCDYLFNELRKNQITDIRLSHHFQASKTLHSVHPETVEAITAILKENGFSVHYNSTITTDNYMFVEENCEKAFSLGVERIKFFPLKKLGHAKNMSADLGLNFEQMQTFYTLLLKQREKYNINQLAVKVSGDLAGIAEKFTCTFGKNSYAITPDMKIYGCVYSISAFPAIGHLLYDGTIVIDNEIVHDCKRCLLNTD